MTEKTLYQQLAEAIGAGESELIAKVFEALANENEAKVLLAAAPPATIDELSEKTGLPSKDIEKMVDPLFKKGLIFMSKKEGPTRYYRVRNVAQFHDATAVAVDASREMLDLWKEYTDTEWGEYLKQIEAVIPQSLVRVVPVNVTIDSKAQILAFEDVKSIVDGAKSLAVTRCSCRVIDGKCRKPVEVCIQVNRAADYAIERGTGRALSAEEAVDMLKMCEQEGLVHVSDNRKAVGHVICNCCNDCCINWPSVRTGLKKFIAPSRFEAQVDADSCSGCETCLEKCFFEAINMEGSDETAVVDPDRCMGCGVCIVTCPTDAITLKEVRAPDFVPE